MAGCAAENEQKKQLTAIDILGEKRKRRPLFYYPCRVAKLEHSGQDKEDRISRLPQDILVAILSRLTLQEAGRTSVLSNKWRYLWTFITRRLNFDAWKSVLNLDLSRGVRINSFTYASWVNQVLKHHQSPFIDEFIIRFCLNCHFYHHVDSWIKFAFGKGVKRFELDLLNDRPSDCRPSYKFPSLEKFQSSSNTVQGMQSYGHATQAVGSVGFSSLTTLRLRYVNVTDKVIENFLGNCPLLEELHVVWSKRLRNLKVVGISLKLKSLEISNCIGLRVLEICAINLVSFSYTGPRIRLLPTNVPVLSKFSTAGVYCQHLMYKDHMDSSYLQQLERLKMKFVSEVFKASISFTREFTKLCRLKQLELEIWAELGDSLVIYTCLIKACPSLSRFAMRSLADFLWKGIIMIWGGLANLIYCCKVSGACYHAGKGLWMKYSRARLSHFEESSTSSGEVRFNVVEEARVQASTRFQHQCLKVVELAGFIGHAEDLELASHLLEIAVSLDKLVINPRNPYFLDNPDMPMKSEDLERGRRCARLLETKLPPEASLVVL